MIAIGIALLFVAYVADILFDVNTVSHNARVAWGWVALVGASMIIAGLILLAWRWLP